MTNYLKILQKQTFKYVKNRQKPNKKYKLSSLFNIFDYILNKINQNVLFHLSNQTLNKKSLPIIKIYWIAILERIP